MTMLSDKLDRDSFLVNQRHRSWMKSKYYVYDDGGNPLFYVERPVKPLQRANITVYDDDSMASSVLVIRQDHGYAALKREYTLLDASSNAEIAHFSRHNIKSWLRRHWAVTSPDGAPLAHAREDTALLAGLRRVAELVLAFIPFGGLLGAAVRTNFRMLRVAEDGAEVQAGTFNRKFSIGDKYKLDLSEDPLRQLDRRVALALGIMLDTGEAR
jgi:uncharacterized protein YxjI